MAAVFYLSLPVTQGRGLSELSPGEILGAGMLGVDAAAFVLIILAAIHVGSEYSTGMIQSTLIITPARGRVLAGKFVTIGATPWPSARSRPWCAWRPPSSWLGRSASIRARFSRRAGVQFALGSIAMPVLYSVIAASAAFVCRSTALGMAIPLVVMAVGGLAGWFGDRVSALLDSADARRGDP